MESKPLPPDVPKFLREFATRFENSVNGSRVVLGELEGVVLDADTLRAIADALPLLPRTRAGCRCSRKQTADKESVTNNTPEQHAQLLRLLGGIGSPTELEAVLLKIGDRTTAVGSTISVSYSHSATYWRTARWTIYKLVAELAEVRKDG